MNLNSKWARGVSGILSNHQLFLQNPLSWMFDRVLNTPLSTFTSCLRSTLTFSFPDFHTLSLLQETLGSNFFTSHSDGLEIFLRPFQVDFLCRSRTLIISFYEQICW